MSNASEPGGLFERRIGRRAALRAGMLAGTGIAAAALNGCGDDDEQAKPAAATPTQAAKDTGPAKPPAEPDFVSDAKRDGAPFPYNYTEPDKKPKPGGTLVVGVSWDIATWDTTKSSAGGTVTVPNTTMNRLIGIVNGPKMSKYKVELQPELAKSWEVAPDGLKYTFRLQDGVKFHNVDPVNGRAFTAKDVLAVYDRHSKDGVSKGFFTEVDKITAPDDKTIVIAMKVPNADFLIPLANRQLPMYPIELVEGDRIAKLPIGTGPAILAEAKPAGFVKFKSNPDYWDGKPLIDGLEYRIITDQAARLAAFRAGQLDYAYGIPSNKLEADAVLKSNPDVVVTADPILMTSGSWGLNLTNPKFQDERVRQALALAIDRKRVNQIVYQGFAKDVPTQAWPFVFDKLPTGDELGKWVRTDPAEAKRLLAAAGVDKLEFNVIYSPAYGGQGEQESTLYTDMLRDIGVNAKLENVGGQTEFNVQWVAVKYKDAADGWATAPPSANGFYHDQVRSGQVNNRWYINDKQLDDWADQQKVELDPRKRKDIWRKEWDRLQDKVYRLDQAQSYALQAYQPWLRYARFNGPYIAIHYFYEWGLLYKNLWLDK